MTGHVFVTDETLTATLLNGRFDAVEAAADASGQAAAAAAQAAAATDAAAKANAAQAAIVAAQAAAIAAAAADATTKANAAQAAAIAAIPTTSVPRAKQYSVVSHTYTASGAIAPADDVAVLNSTSALAMSLAAGTTDKRITIKMFGAATATVSAVIDGITQSITLDGTGALKDSLVLIWNTSLATYLAE